MYSRASASALPSALASVSGNDYEHIDISKIVKSSIKLDDDIPLENDTPAGLFSDVEEEINGLFTYDREVLKVDKNRMLTIARQLFENIR